MANRTPLLNRPWLNSTCYDKLTRSTVLHCDAYVLDMAPVQYLYIEWREAGRKLIAQDAWLIERDGLTPVWDAEAIRQRGQPALWSRMNAPLMAPLHAFVLGKASDASRFKAWSRVSVRCHYVRVKEASGEVGANRSTRPVKYKPRAKPLPDWL